MEEITLELKERRLEDGVTAKRLRTQDLVPGVVYGGGKPPIAVVVPAKTLAGVRSRGANTILSLKIGSGADTAFIKAVQRHPVSGDTVHVDFLRIRLTEKIEVSVPLHAMGEAPGVKHHGGILEHELRSVRVRALPAKIPPSIDIDISSLEIGGHVLVKDLRIPEGVEVLDGPEHMVLHVAAPKAEEVPAAPEAAQAAAQPELSAVKGKKDEEGKPLREAAAPAKAAGGKEPAPKAAAKEPGK